MDIHNIIANALPVCKVGIFGRERKGGGGGSTTIKACGIWDMRLGFRMRVHYFLLVDILGVKRNQFHFMVRRLYLSYS